ncbi:hypothetical protein N24_1913 [Corynebacterium suranareeae]|uniref:Uncharacterized protein n=1 Tax=Corynebacterium suranareeae TaxID=2506452 RepID=A0A160PRJ1_9CORY|nr:hypothetical protein [Corynebacterium suranareeae]BAU96175.1 hypothetical protein N24_1913 [Corynebacterium suranareeae]
MTFLHPNATFHPPTLDRLTDLGLDPEQLVAELPTIVYEVQPHNVFVLQFAAVDVRVYQEGDALFIRSAELINPELRKRQRNELLKSILDQSAPRVRDDISGRTTIFLKNKSVVTQGRGPITVIPHNPDEASAKAAATKHKSTLPGTASRHPYVNMTLSEMLKQGFTLTPLEFPLCAVDDPKDSGRTMHVINVREHSV